jgi:hypothetical protein
MVSFKGLLVVGTLILGTAPFGAGMLPTAPFRAGMLPTAPFRAVDPVGAYCILEQVVVDSGDHAPGRVQMWGAFVLADPAATGGYGPASRGYMYYTCPPGRSTACTSEWADLRWISGTGKAIGYGLRGKPIGRLRREDEAVGSPDLYPLDGGLVKVESKDPAFTDLVAQLKAALAGRLYLLMARTFAASITNMPRP